MNRSSRIPILIAAGFIIAAGILTFILLRGVQDNVNVVVPKNDLAAYSFVDADDVEFTGVPKASVTEYDLTEEEFNDTYDGEFVISSAVLTGQIIDKRYIPEADNASFAVVMPDERVVAATSSVAGAAVGTIQAGDVVSVQSGDGGITGGGGGSSEYVKVLCIATEPSGCQGVLPPGVNINAEDTDSQQAAANDAPVLVLLAVESDSAGAIAGQQVTLALNPFCRVDKEGYFYSPRSNGDSANFKCNAPQTRIAARPPAADNTAEQEQVEQ